MPGDNVEMTLYIPLCFLLIKSQLPARHFRDMLYIPLCFLLILHSGGLVLNHISLHSTMFSINQPGNKIHLTGGNPLHSTMFSINLKLRGLKLSLKGPLHSTMFSINPGSHSLSGTAY